MNWRKRYTVFLRPRRFGKSLLVSILQCYYDVDYAHCFDELFGGLKIAANPTDERGKYLALIFNFSGVDKQLDRYARDKNIARWSSSTEVRSSSAKRFSFLGKR